MQNAPDEKSAVKSSRALSAWRLVWQRIGVWVQTVRGTKKVYPQQSLDEEPLYDPMQAFEVQQQRQEQGADVQKKHADPSMVDEKQPQAQWYQLLHALRLEPARALEYASAHNQWQQSERLVQLKCQKKPLDTILLRQNDALWSWCKKHADAKALHDFVDQKAPLLAQYARGVFDSEFVSQTGADGTPKAHAAWVHWARREGYWSKGLDPARQDALLGSALEYKDGVLMQEHMQEFGISALEQERLEGILGALGERKERALFEGMDQEHVELMQIFLGADGSFLDLLERLPEGALRKMILLLLRALQNEQEQQVLKTLHERLKSAKAKVLFEKALVISASTSNRSALLGQWLERTGIDAKDGFDKVWLLEQKNKEHQLRSLQLVEQSLNLLEIAKVSGAQKVASMLEKMGVKARAQVVESVIQKGNAPTAPKQ